MNKRANVGLGFLLSAALMSAACSTGETPAGRSGVTKPAKELTLAQFAAPTIGDGGETLGLLRFIEQVEGRSGGRLRIRVEGDAGGGDEVQSLKDVAAGKADLGWAGTRALDKVGFDRLAPLSAPFLIDSYARERAVVTDPQVSAEIKGLDRIGLKGLALLADEMRLPAGVTRPLRRPADYAGAEIRTQPSAIQEKALTALGAIPVTDDRQVDAHERNQAITGTQTAPFLTLNTPLWPQALVLFANPTRWDALDAQEQEWLTGAAEYAATWSAENAGGWLGTELRNYCGMGNGRIVTAEPADVAALRTTVAPVYAELRSRPSTSAVMARVEELVKAAPADPAATIPDGCAFRPGDESLALTHIDLLPSPGRTGALPQGTYRYELTEENMQQAVGMTAEDIRINIGVYTWTLGNGRWTYEQRPQSDSTVLNTTCAGYYDVNGSTVTFSLSGEAPVRQCAPWRWTAVWGRDGEAVTWSRVASADGDAGFAAVWPATWVKAE